MIIDRIQHADYYKSMDDRIRRGLEFLERTDFSGIAPGRYTEDEELSYLVQEFDTAPVDHNCWEYHRRTTDIQFILSGVEGFGYTDVSRLGDETTAYDPEDDLGHCRGEGDFVELRPGMFAIQFPHDAHLPDRHVTSPSHVRKIVVKIKWEE